MGPAGWLLPAALSFLVSVLTLTGELDRAGELAAESIGISEAIGAAPLRHGPVMLAAWRGDHAVAAHLTDITRRDVANPEGGGEVAVAGYAMAVLHTGSATTPSPELQRSERVRPMSWERGTSTCRSSSRPPYEPATRRPQRTPWNSSVRARSPATRRGRSAWRPDRALISAGPVAEEQYREAVERLSTSRMTAETGRSHLVYGEWLRREGRRQDARAQLRTAHRMFSDMGMDAFAGPRPRTARHRRAPPQT